jgi:pyridoxine 5-phosphate synthase
MTKLSVNVNKIALLRNSRTIGIPDVCHLADIALDAGAHGITVHPRPDERHIRSHDVYQLAELVGARPGAEFNIEGNPFHQVLKFVTEVRPHQCTLVPDDPSAFTSDHGWDLKRDGERLRPIIAKLREIGVRVSLFMDPDPAAMQLARDVGADRIELYTEPYARDYGTSARAGSIARYSAAAAAAVQSGLGLNAGHDLNCENLPAFVAAIPDLAEVSIGHALTADALEFGMAGAVKAYLDAIRRGSSIS